jgi:hypothetical protein
MREQEMDFQFSIGNIKFSFSKAFRLGLRPSQHHIQWVLWASSRGVKRPEGEVNISKVQKYLNFKEEQMFAINIFEKYFDHRILM